MSLRVLSLATAFVLCGSFGPAVVAQPAPAFPPEAEEIALEIEDLVDHHIGKLDDSKGKSIRRANRHRDRGRFEKAITKAEKDCRKIERIVRRGLRKIDRLCDEGAEFFDPVLDAVALEEWFAMCDSLAQELIDAGDDACQELRDTADPPAPPGPPAP